MSKELFIPMSSLQCAYMIERERGLKTTGTPCHVYMEFDTVSINETHLRKAWETLYVRHPMMRAKAEMCGLLKIEELNDREAERTIKIWEEDIFIKENMREILSHEKLDIRNGINCRLHLIKRHQKIVRLAFDLDLTMCDVLSFLIILRDLGEFYRYFKRGIIREYHSNEIEEEVLLSENRKSDKVYWEQRLRNSDIAFPLKVKGSIEELVKTKYISINRKMDKKVLDRLTLKLKISTEEILLIVFSYTVLKYTKKEQVLINFPFSNRTKERQNRVGDYTKSIIYRFERVLKRLGKKDNTVLKETDPIGLPEKTQAVRNKVNATERELPESLMAEGFVKSCVLYPNKTALITKDGEYTYAALKQYVSAVQHTLLENGLKPGDSAAVMLPKGIWQIAGVLGTLLAGGVYLPIDSKQPLQRRNDIIQDSGVKFVLTEKVEELYNQEKLTTINVNILDATTEYQLREIAGVRGSDPAYIIYTSGTTGKPKGVVISHEAAIELN